MVRFRRINTTERRSSRRLSASEVLPQSVTKLASGQEVELVNIALNGGILINSQTMLSPGSCVRLKLNSLECAIVLEGRVQRCKVVGLKRAKIQYEAVILLDDGFPEPLAETLHHADEEKRFVEQYAEGLSPDDLKLPDTAQLWILSSQGAEVNA